MADDRFYGRGKGPVLKFIHIKKILSFCLLAAASCGIEDYVYLEPVTNASTSGGSTAFFTTPNNPSAEFRYYQIYYRIYLSN
ncbi:MAG: hypothetical protein LBB82_01415, partial [Treponema sp.]|nr:hypothetical protein [Treponema sp.]